MLAVNSLSSAFVPPTTLIALGLICSGYVFWRLVSFDIPTFEDAVAVPSAEQAPLTDRLFVAAIQRVHHDDEHIAVAQRTWLRRVPYRIFTQKPTTVAWRNRTRVHFPHAIHDEIAQVRWLSAFVELFLASNAEWFIIVPLDSYIIYENLLPLLRTMRHDQASFGIIENHGNSTISLLVLNRLALSFLARASTPGTCSMMSIRVCLAKVGHAIELDFARDTTGRPRFLVQQRHMQLREYSSNGTGYTDGGSIYQSLSSHIHSFFNVRPSEAEWLDSMIYLMQRFP